MVESSIPGALLLRDLAGELVVQPDLLKCALKRGRLGLEIPVFSDQTGDIKLFTAFVFGQSPADAVLSFATDPLPGASDTSEATQSLVVSWGPGLQDLLLDALLLAGFLEARRRWPNGRLAGCYCDGERVGFLVTRPISLTEIESYDDEDEPWVVGGPEDLDADLEPLWRIVCEGEWELDHTWIGQAEIEALDQGFRLRLGAGLRCRAGLHGRFMLEGWATDEPEVLLLKVDRLGLGTGRLEAGASLKADLDPEAARALADQVMAQLPSELSDADSSKKLAEGLVTAVTQAFPWKAGAVLAAGSQERSLLKVRMDLRREDARKALEAALSGRFQPIIAVAARPDSGVKMMGGDIWQAFERSRKAVIDLPWMARGTRDIEREERKDSWVVGEDGIVRRQTRRLSQTSSWYHARSQEEEELKFLFEFVTALTDPDEGPAQLETLNVSYKLLANDANMLAEELRPTLYFAHRLGLADDVDTTVRRLSEAFPEGLGPTKVDISAEYSAEALVGAFSLSSKTLRHTVEKAFRRLVGTHGLAVKQPGPKAAIAAAFWAGADPLKARGVEVPAKITGSAPWSLTLDSGARKILDFLCRTEQRLLQRLDQIRDLLAPETSRDADWSNALIDAVSELVELDDRLAQQAGPHALMGIIDQLVRVGAGSRGRSVVRNIQVRPPGTDEDRSLFAVLGSSNNTDPEGA